MSTENIPPINNTNKKKGVESAQIQELLWPITEIVRKIKPSIESGEYAMIVGDDASGRLPALVLRDIINKVYAKSGRPNIDTRFVALYSTLDYKEAWDKLTPPPNTEQTLSQREVDERRQKDATEKIEHDFITRIDKDTLANKKILIVTDIISTGRSLMPLLQALKDANLEFDISCVSSHTSDQTIKKLEEIASHVFIGSIGKLTVYKRNDISGVMKDEQEINLTALPYKKILDDPHWQQISQLRINKARQDAQRIADQVFESIWGKE